MACSKSSAGEGGEGVSKRDPPALQQGLKDTEAPVVPQPQLWWSDPANNSVNPETSINDSVHPETIQKITGIHGKP